MKSLLAAVLLLASPALAEETLLERLRAEIRALGERHESLQRLEKAAADVESVASRVERHVDDGIRFLRDIGPCGAADESMPADMGAPHEVLHEIPEEVDQAFAELEASLDEAKKLATPQRPERFHESLQRVLETADDMLARRRDTSIAARWLRRFANERRRSDTHQKLCRLLESVAPLPEPFTLSDVRRDPLLPVRRMGEATQRQLTHRANALQRGEWSLELGVIWTPMRVGGESRAGQPVAMVAFRPLPEDLPILRDATFRPWVEVGAGLQFDEPSFYVGGAFDVGPYVHAGVGWTAQDTGDEFDGDVYVSLTIRAEKLREWLSR